MMRYGVTKKVKSVNNKSIAQEISSFIEDGITSFGILWDSASQRETLAEVVEDFIGELADEQKQIMSYKVICDRRNNTVTENDNGIYHLDIHFQQKNCLNTTKLLYTITSSYEDDESQFVIDFTL